MEKPDNEYEENPRRNPNEEYENVMEEKPTPDNDSLNFENDAGGLARNPNQLHTNISDLQTNLRNADYNADIFPGENERVVMNPSATIRRLDPELNIPTEILDHKNINDIDPYVDENQAKLTENMETYRKLKEIFERDDDNIDDNIFIKGNKKLNFEKMFDALPQRNSEKSDVYPVNVPIDVVKSGSTKKFLYKELGRKNYFLPKFSSNAVTNRSLLRMWNSSKYMIFSKNQIEEKYDQFKNFHKTAFNLKSTYIFIQYYLKDVFGKILPFDSTPDRLFVKKIIVFLDPENKLALTKKIIPESENRILGKIRVNGNIIPITKDKKINNIKQDIALINSHFKEYIKCLRETQMEFKNVKNEASKTMENLKKRLSNFPEVEKMRLLNSKQASVIDAVTNSEIDLNEKETRVIETLKRLGYKDKNITRDYAEFMRFCKERYKKQISFGKIEDLKTHSEMNILRKNYPYAMLNCSSLFDYRDLFFELGYHQWELLMDRIDHISFDSVAHARKKNEVIETYPDCFSKYN